MLHLFIYNFEKDLSPDATNTDRISNVPSAIAVSLNEVITKKVLWERNIIIRQFFYYENMKLIGV